jgi:hypothetical protein
MRQLEAYNRRDIEAFCREFSEDVIVTALNTESVLIAGIAKFRETYDKLFRDSPTLHAEILHRTVYGNHVIDHDRVTGRAGVALIEVAAIYAIDPAQQKITRVWFVRGG